MDWGLQAHPDYHKDYWIGDSGASSHMVGDTKDLFTKTPSEGKVNAVNGSSMPIVCKGKMNMEVVPKQGKSSKGILTIKDPDGMLHKFFSFTTALMHDWKMYGMKKQNSDTEIKSTHEHFESIMFGRVLGFDDAVLVAAKIKTLPSNSNQEEAHTTMLEGHIPRKVLHQLTGHAGQQLMIDTAKHYGVQVTGTVTKCLNCF